jgi:tetratricopeptide (TPR) repeat protein
VGTFGFTLEQLPGLVAKGGPFHFTCDWSGDSGVITIPIINRGPESVAVSQPQEDWLSARFPNLESCFAGAWRTTDRALFSRVCNALAALDRGPPAAQRELLAALRVRPVPSGASKGVPSFSSAAPGTEEERAAARVGDLEDYDRLVALAPLEPEAWVLRAERRRSAHGDVAGALADFTHACGLSPSSPSAWDGMGSCLLDLGRTAEAIPAFRRALLASTQPGQVRAARLQLARAHAQAGQHEEALVQWESVAPPGRAGKPLADDGTVHQSRARALSALGRTLEALQALGEASRCQPGESGPHVARARILWEMPEKAEEALAAAALAAQRAKPWEHEPLLVHGGVLRSRGRFEEALPVLEEGLRRAPSDMGLAAELGVVLVQLGQDDRALELLNRYLETASWHPAQLARARARWRRRGDLLGARADVARVLEQSPGHPEATALRDELAAARHS